MSVKLKLNEALLVVNKVNISGPLEVFRQLEECYGCPLDKLTPLANVSDVDEKQQDQFVVKTPRNFHLELRQIEPQDGKTVKNWCRFDEVALNSYGQYRIDVSSAKPDVNNRPNGSHQSLECVFNTVDPGECLFCPIAILVCIMFAIIAVEQVYKQFWSPNRKRLQHRRVNEKIGSPSDNTNHGDGANVGENHAYGTQAHDLGADTSNAAARATTSTTLESDNGIMELSTKSQHRRVESLDIFRGFTLAGMIFVNYGGAGYAILEHKAWDGITLADFVFPFFIFSMGASVAISAKSMIRRHQKSFQTIASKIFRRSLTLAVLGICLNSQWVNYNQADGLRRLRLTGVLQRFSISYLVVALMYTIELTINRWFRAQSLSNVPYLSKLLGAVFELLTAVNYGAIYIYLTFYFNYDKSCPPGYIGPGGLTEGGNYANCTGGAAAWIDRFLLTPNHMYNDHEVKEIFKTEYSHDPEGILGYTTSILLTLIGLQCGKILTSRGSHKRTIIALCNWSIVMLLASSLIVIIPINKRLWSLTFVSVTAFAAFMIIIMMYILVDVYSCKKSIVIQLLSSAGKNSIFLYVGHSLIHNMLPWWFPIGPQATHLQLLLRLSWSTLVWLLVAQFMATKKIFIKV